MDPSLVVALRAAHHALRGVAAVLAGGALLASASAGRRALLSLRASQLAALKLVRPSQNSVAIAVFVGVFRLIHRYERERRRPELPSLNDPDTTSADDQISTTALAAAAVSSLACLAPDSRTPLISLVATNALSTWYPRFMADHPELAVLKPLDLVVFMASSGWIYYSGFFHPDSYDPSHLTLIKKYSLTAERVATYLQARYALGLNATPCDVRHPGRACGEFARTTFLHRLVTMALRIYAPVHITTWLLALRHKGVRAKPLRAHVEQLVRRIVQSALYYVVYVFFGWTTSCYTNAIGARSLTHRKVQMLVCGALPALAIQFESSSRRRPIAVILSSYAFVSMGTVLSQQRGFQWLQRGAGPVRTVLDVVVAAVSVAYTFGDIIEGSAVVQRMLLGRPTAKRIRRYSAGKEHADDTRRDEPSTV